MVISLIENDMTHLIYMTYLTLSDLFDLFDLFTYLAPSCKLNTI